MQALVPVPVPVPVLAIVQPGVLSALPSPRQVPKRQRNLKHRPRRRRRGPVLRQLLRLYSGLKFRHLRFVLRPSIAAKPHPPFDWVGLQ